MPRLTTRRGCATLLDGPGYDPKPDDPPLRTAILRCLFPCLFAGRLGLCTEDTGPTAEPGKIVETVTTYRTDPGTAILVFNVFGEKARSRLDRQALLTLVNLADQSATWTTTEDNAKACVYQRSIGKLPGGRKRRRLFDCT